MLSTFLYYLTMRYSLVSLQVYPLLKMFRQENLRNMPILMDK